MTQHIGIFAGTFDPVHEGHVAFVTQAIDSLSLDSVIILPERAPRGKHDITPLVHRKAMLEFAFADMPKVKVHHQPRDYSVFPDTLHDSELGTVTHLLLGSDVAFTLKTWPGGGELLKQTHAVIGVRDKRDMARIHTLMGHLGSLPSSYSVVHTKQAGHSSSHARTNSARFHPKIQAYIKKHRLYTV